MFFFCAQIYTRRLMLSDTHSYSELPLDLPTNYVVYLFNSPEPYELAALYHNVSLQPISVLLLNISLRISRGPSSNISPRSFKQGYHVGLQLPLENHSRLEAT